MDKNYYKDYYHLERHNWWFTVRSKILAERIKASCQSPKDLHILNVGVATGATSEMLGQFGEVMSVEYDRECYEFTKSILSTPIINGSILELPFANNSYDLVCAFDVIEHVKDDAKAVAEMVRVCKPNGWIVVTVPTFMSLWGQHDVINHHYKRYVMPELVQLFNTHHGKILYQSYFNSLLFPPIYAFRNLMRVLPKNLFRKKDGVGSDHDIIHQDSFVNQVLETVFSIEKKLLHHNITFPVGVSAVIVWQKNIL